MKKATIEILHEGETVLGSRTAGEYFVREYEDGEEMSGSFHKYLHDAVSHVREYQGMEAEWKAEKENSCGEKMQLSG